jgi:hypothetical protein
MASSSARLKAQPNREATPNLSPPSEYLPNSCVSVNKLFDRTPNELCNMTLAPRPAALLETLRPLTQFDVDSPASDARDQLATTPLSELTKPHPAANKIPTRPQTESCTPRFDPGPPEIKNSKAQESPKRGTRHRKNSNSKESRWKGRREGTSKLDRILRPPKPKLSLLELILTGVDQSIQDIVKRRSQRLHH